MTACKTYGCPTDVYSLGAVLKNLYPPGAAPWYVMAACAEDPADRPSASQLIGFTGCPPVPVKGRKKARADRRRRHKAALLDQKRRGLWSL